MITELSEESRILKDSVREFALSEPALHVMEWGEVRRFPIDIIPKMAKVRLLGGVIPQDLGGERSFVSRVPPGRQTLYHGREHQRNPENRNRAADPELTRKRCVNP
jgi:alkylation response protein AidB-like acyl-CoA dehydrogenase